jgi:hypothetical protein
MVSPVLGAEGNVEFVVVARPPDPARPDAAGAPRLDETGLDAVIGEAIERQAR